MSSRVLVVGCGLAGPVIALQLKQKGYHPIVLEKVKELGDAGASLMMMPNGLKVLSLINFDKSITESAPHLRELCEFASSGRRLGSSDAPSHWKESYGQPACGIKRTTLNLALKKALTDAEIELHEGWKLKDIIEKSDSVTAIIEQGETIEASFLIGCDGIKSVSRTLIVAQHGVEEEDPSYTGLTQTAGISPTPLGFNSSPGRLNIYGPGVHFICYPISSTTTSWAITQRDLTAAQETWRSFRDEELVDQREKLLDFFKEWSSPVPELIRGAERLIKYGLYDRSHLQPEHWVSKGGRCVLIGDAAHPTSPHLGQGANQALEDCYHLSRSLPDLDPQHPLDSKTLSEVFSKFARLRQPRTAALVKGARAQGEDRVVDGGLAACAERDQRIHLAWQNEEAMKASFDALLKEPFCP